VCAMLRPQSGRYMLCTTDSWQPLWLQIWMAEAAMPAARQLLEAAQAAAPGERFVWDMPLLRPAADDKQARRGACMLIRIPPC
jgi:hypothetical protein